MGNLGWDHLTSVVGSNCYQVGRARLGQPWEGRALGHRGASGDPRAGRERNSPVGSPRGSRAGRNHRGHSYPIIFINAA